MMLLQYPWLLLLWLSTAGMAFGAASARTKSAETALFVCAALLLNGALVGSFAFGLPTEEILLMLFLLLFALAPALWKGERP